MSALFLRMSFRQGWLERFFFLRNATVDLSLNVLLSFVSALQMLSFCSNIDGSCFNLGCHVHTITVCGSFLCKSLSSRNYFSRFIFLTSSIVRLRYFSSEKGLEVFILDHSIPSPEERKRLEDKYICKLQPLQSNDGGMNRGTGPFAKEMYRPWTTAIKSMSTAFRMFG